MATLDIVTTEQVLAQVKIPDGEASLLGSYITTVSRHIDDLCGPVVQRTVTDEAHHGGSCSIVLEQYPVMSVTTITENGTEIDPTGYHVDNESGLVERISAGSYSSYPWCRGRWNLLVTYVAGRYATTAAVDGIFAQAAIMAVKGLWTSQKAIGGTQSFGAYGSDLEVNSETAGGQHFVFPRAAYMLLRGGNYIKSKAFIA